MSGQDFEIPDDERAAEPEPAWVEPERLADLAGEASEADVLDQAQEVDPGERVSSVVPPDDAPEADAWEQAHEVPPDDGWDDERQADAGSVHEG